MRISRTETDEELIVERTLYTRRYLLVLDKKRCIRCELCQITCPKEAIEITVAERNSEEKYLSISIDEEKCSFCGICSAICPMGAITLKINEEETIPVLEKESFPKLIHEIKVDYSKCPIDCNECQEACPFNLIDIHKDKKKKIVKIDVDAAHCPGCRLCELKCPEGAISVKKIFFGVIRIEKEKCPEGCHSCVDVCPVPDVLKIANDGKVEVNDYCCIYCGACKVACPVPEALILKRTVIMHTPVQSGAWNSALEKLTSTKELSKELAAKRMMKAIDAVKRRAG